MNPIGELLVGLTILVQAMVDEPGAVKLTATHTGKTSTITLFVAPKDEAKMIGKQGRTARSLRILLSAAGMTCGRIITLDIPSTKPASGSTFVG